MMSKILSLDSSLHIDEKIMEEAIEKAEHIGYPVVVRPSFVLGGRAMEIVYSRGMLERYMSLEVEASPERPVLIDKFLDDAVEVDVEVPHGEVVEALDEVDQAFVHLEPIHLRDPSLDGTGR